MRRKEQTNLFQHVCQGNTGKVETITEGGSEDIVASGRKSIKKLGNLPCRIPKGLIIWRSHEGVNTGRFFVYSMSCFIEQLASLSFPFIPLTIPGDCPSLSHWLSWPEIRSLLCRHISSKYLERDILVKKWSRDEEDVGQGKKSGKAMAYSLCYRSFASLFILVTTFRKHGLCTPKQDLRGRFCREIEGSQ